MTSNPAGYCPKTMNRFTCREPKGLAARVGHTVRHGVGECGGEDGRRLVAPIFDLPEWPATPFPAISFGPSEKVPAVDTFMADKSCTWVGEPNDTGDVRPGRRRESPTLLLDVVLVLGLTLDMVDQLLERAGSISE